MTAIDRVGNLAPLPVRLEALLQDFGVDGALVSMTFWVSGEHTPGGGQIVDRPLSGLTTCGGRDGCGDTMVILNGPREVYHCDGLENLTWRPAKA